MLLIVVECCWYPWYRYSISLYDVETTPCNACHSGLMIICRCKHEPTGIAWHSSFFSICFPSRLVYIVHPGRLTEGSPTNHPWKERISWSEPSTSMILLDVDLQGVSHVAALPGSNSLVARWILAAQTERRTASGPWERGYLLSESKDVPSMYGTRIFTYIYSWYLW